MIQGKTISTSFNNLKNRIVKFTGLGNNDVKTAKEANAYGFDSNPVKGMIAIYADTLTKGNKVIVGYLNVNQLADVGECRLFSTDSDGNLKIDLWLKNDGTIEIGGSADNVVRYSPLNTGLQNLVTALQAELVKIAAGVAGGGGSYTPGTLSVDITSSKVNQLKTP